MNKIINSSKSFKQIQKKSLNTSPFTMKSLSDVYFVHFGKIKQITARKTIFLHLQANLIQITRKY